MQCTLSSRFWSKSQVSKFSRYSRYSRLHLWNPWKTWNLDLFAQDVSDSAWDFKRWCDLRANLYYGLNNSNICSRPWPSCANKCSAHFRPDFDRNLKFQVFKVFKASPFEVLKKLETWICLHKTFRATTWDFKRWCDLRANLHYGLNNSNICARPWPSCANKCSAHYRADFGRNLKFSRKFETWNCLHKTFPTVPEISNGGVICAPTCTMV
jgi:hypothetical protein